MKKKALLIVVITTLACFVPSSFAADIGGSNDGSTSFASSDGYALYLQDKVTLWFDSGQEKNSYLSAQGSYTYAIDQPYFFDLEKLSYTGIFPGALKGNSLLTFRAGRFHVSDFTGNVLDHNIDALSIELSYPSIITSLSVGYTGLLFAESSSVILSKADLSDFSTTDVLLGAPRLVEAVEFLFPELFWGQDLVISFLAQQDLRPEDELVAEGEENEIAGTGGKLNTQYYGLGIVGPLSSSLYHNLFFYLSTGSTLSYLADAASGTGYSYSYQPILAYLFGAGLRYFNENALYSKLELNVLFSSGDEDYTSYFEGNTAGRAGAFIPISQPVFGLVFSPDPGNMFFAELSYSLKPLARSKYTRMRELQTMINAYGFFRPTVGAISEYGVDDTSDSLYLGTEIEGVVNFRPFSDLGVTLALGLFIPNNTSGGAFLEAERETEVFGRIDISFGF